MRLNKPQLLAVHHGNGPLLALACPGSGKTTVIIQRILNLISVYGIAPENILAVTFSRAAADEMSRRFMKEYKGFSKPYFGTFHSIFLMILRSCSGQASSAIISEKEKYTFFRSEIIKSNVSGENDQIHLLRRRSLFR